MSLDHLTDPEPTWRDILFLLERAKAQIKEKMSYKKGEKK